MIDRVGLIVTVDDQVQFMVNVDFTVQANGSIVAIFEKIPGVLVARCLRESLHMVNLAIDTIVNFYRREGGIPHLVNYLNKQEVEYALLG